MKCALVIYANINAVNYVLNAILHPIEQKYRRITNMSARLEKLEERVNRLNELNALLKPKSKKSKI